MKINFTLIPYSFFFGFLITIFIFLVLGLIVYTIPSLINGKIDPNKDFYLALGYYLSMTSLDFMLSLSMFWAIQDIKKINN